MNSMQMFLGSNNNLVKFSNNWQRVIRVVRINQDRLSRKLTANFSSNLLNRYYELCDLENAILAKYRTMQKNHGHWFNTVIMGRENNAVLQALAVDKMQALNNCKAAELQEMMSSFRK